MIHQAALGFIPGAALFHVLEILRSEMRTVKFVYDDSGKQFWRK